MGRGAAGVGKFMKGTGYLGGDLPAASQRRRPSGAVTQREPTAHEVERERKAQRRREMTALTSSETQDLNRLRQCVLMGHRDTLRVDRLTSLRRDVLTLSGDFVAAGERVGRYAVQSEKAASERSGQIERAAQTHGRALDDIVVGTWRHRLMDVVESRSACDGVPDGRPLNRRSGGRLSDLERAWTQETASVAASNQSDLRFFQRREVEARHAVDDAVEDSKQAFQAAKEAMRNRYMERANNLRVWLGSKIDAIEVRRSVRRGRQPFDRAALGRPCSTRSTPGTWTRRRTGRGTSRRCRRATRPRRRRSTSARDERTA